MNAKRVVQHALNDCDHNRQMLRKATRHHGIYRYLFHSNLAIARSIYPEQFVWPPPASLKEGRNEIGLGQNDG